MMAAAVASPAAAPEGAAPGGLAGPSAGPAVPAGPGAGAAGGGGAAAKSGEERLKEMEAEMALFEQEVLGAPTPGDLLTPPPVLRPIIATNTYQQVSSDILGGASGLLPAVIPAPALEYRAKTQGMLRACSSPALGCATSTQLLLGSSLQPSTGGFSSARGPLLVESSRSSCNNSPSPIPASGDVSLELPLFCDMSQSEAIGICLSLKKLEGLLKRMSYEMDQTLSAIVNSKIKGALIEEVWKKRRNSNPVLFMAGLHQQRFGKGSTHVCYKHAGG
ncbi:uncharacterized protein LOC127461295 isoform X1 [Manacus candei]|uniref:uncharacterized protein LOC127461295 isoform X1 n=1 Tax=Manacus candei TaxID=415023 RepID=UPI0022270861|nr:uncharacterized protein LOC127461295 isoform X1 [Manacus candei]